MIVAFRKPPFLWLIRLFIGTPPKDAVYTYGRTIYSPSSTRLSADLIEHERTHRIQQGAAPWLWWARYLLDRRFRLRQETAAYRAQVRWHRAYGHAVLPRHQMAQLLSGPLYGRLCSYDEARAA